MASVDYSTELAKAREDLAKAEAQVTKLRQLVAALSALCTEDVSNLNAAELAGPVKDMGLTDAIRAVFVTDSRVWLGATEVKEQLDVRTFDWSSYSQPMSAIHTVLKRLKATVLTSREEGGRTVYRCIGNVERRIRERTAGRGVQGR